MTRAESPWALPVTLAAVPAAFHAYLLISGTTLGQAQDAGWVLKPEVRCAVLCCAVLCCAVLCCAVLCCAVLCDITCCMLCVPYQQRCPKLCCTWLPK
jgi:hypothetical protein